MLNAIIVEINGIEPVLFERSKRARHVNISVEPFHILEPEFGPALTLCQCLKQRA